jgi:RNA polymerase sigma-B factor
VTTKRVVRPCGALPRQSDPRRVGDRPVPSATTPTVIASDPPPDPLIPAAPTAAVPASDSAAGQPATTPPDLTTTARPDEDEEAILRRLVQLPRHSACRTGLRSQVVEARLPLVHHLALRFQGRGEPLDDLVQVGTIGLLNAVDRFDPSRGAFAAFAVPTILGEIRRHFRDRSWALRVPRRLQDLGRQVSEAREQLTQVLGRSPTVQELAEHLDTEVDLVVEALDTAAVFATVPLPTASEESQFGGLGVCDPSLELVEDRVTLRPLLARLPVRERTILALRFGRGLSQSQIAAEVGISQMHVSRLLARSLTALRQALDGQRVLDGQV